MSWPAPGRSGARQTPCGRFAQPCPAAAARAGEQQAQRVGTLRIPQPLHVFLMRLRRVSWPSAPLRTFLLACTESCTAHACFSPLRKFALLGSALVKANKHVRKGISFSLRGLQLSLQQEDVLVSPTWRDRWSPGTTPTGIEVGKPQGLPGPSTARIPPASALEAGQSWSVPPLPLCCSPRAPGRGQGELQDGAVCGAVPGRSPTFWGGRSSPSPASLTCSLPACRKCS